MNIMHLGHSHQPYTPFRRWFPNARDPLEALVPCSDDGAEPEPFRFLDQLGPLANDGE